MKLTEAHIRKIIREELMKEMGMGDMPPNQPPQEETKLHGGAIATGLGVGGLVALANFLVAELQKKGGMGHDIALKIAELNDLIQASMNE
jgi:hypothetical protein